MRENINGTVAPQAEKQGDIDLKFIVGKVLGNWYWFVISLVSWIIIGVLVMLIFAPKWNISAQVIVNGSNSKVQSGLSSEAGMLSDLGLYSKPVNVNNELQVLHSRTLLNQTIKDLQLNVGYFIEKGIVYRETYDQSPYFIKVLHLEKMPKMKEDPQKYDMTIDKNDVLHFEDDNTDSVFTAHYGDTLHFYYGDWVLIKNPLISADPKADYRLKIASIGSTYEDLNDNIVALVYSADVTAIQITMGSNVKRKGEETLRHLLNLYVQSDIDNNNRIADSTISFINDRLITVSKGLSQVEGNIETFKKSNRIADLDEQGKAFLSNSIETNKALADQQVQIQVTNDLVNYLKDNKNNARVMPTTAPIKDPAFVSLLEKYNNLQLDRQQLLVNSTENNPSVRTLDAQAGTLREDLIKNLQSYAQSLTFSRQDLTRQTNEAATNISNVPTQERVYLEFARKQGVMQSLYTYLLTTREQAEVSKSTISPVRIVDAPEADEIQYFPDPLIVFIVAILLGLITPSITLFVKELLNTKVMVPADIEALSVIPVVSQISRNKGKKTLVVNGETRSEVAEQFRLLRTNLQYLMTNTNEKVILVTSSMGGEGKTFVSINFASVLALAGKKVLLLEMDLRKPKLSSSLGLSNETGVTNYIVSDVSLRDVIKPSGINDNCWVLSSGNIPPNPSELIIHDKVEKLFTEAKAQFDYIVVDTPPAGLVTDAQLISKFTDLTLFVVRQKFTYKRQISMAEEMAANNRLKKMYIVLNDVRKLPGYNYGGNTKYERGYYGYERPWYKRIFGKKESYS